MGHDAKVKAERIHLRKLFGGRTDAVSLWRSHVLTYQWNGHTRPRKCGKCRTHNAIGTINSFWPATDFEKDNRRLAIKYATECGGMIPIVKFNCNGEERAFVAMPVLYFCQDCRRDMEIAAARLPSYVVSEVRTGPHADRILGQVPRPAGQVA